MGVDAAWGIAPRNGNSRWMRRTQSPGHHDDPATIPCERFDVGERPSIRFLRCIQLSGSPAAGLASGHSTERVMRCKALRVGQTAAVEERHNPLLSYAAPPRPIRSVEGSPPRARCPDLRSTPPCGSAGMAGSGRRVVDVVNDELPPLGHVPLHVVTVELLIRNDGPEQPLARPVPARTSSIPGLGPSPPATSARSQRQQPHAVVLCRGATTPSCPADESVAGQH